MSKRREEMQRIIRWYKEETGKTEIRMKDVALFAKLKGLPLPKPVDPLERLAREFSAAAREEERRDEMTGRPYRVNHCYTTMQGDLPLTFWINIDEAPRNLMVKSLQKRREQMVGDAYHLSLDMDHWNAKNAIQEPIQLLLDLTDDVAWRKNGPEEKTA